MGLCGLYNKCQSSVSDPGEGGGGGGGGGVGSGGAPPPPPLSQGLDDPPPPLILTNKLETFRFEDEYSQNSITPESFT